MEYSGEIARVDSEVSNFARGDRVLAMAPGRFSTVERAPAWACIGLEEQEDFASMATMPVVFSTALYALYHRAKLQPNESILIHSATGGLGLAVIQVAKLISAEIFATAGTEAKRRYLIDQCGLKADHVFDSHGTSFESGVMSATGRRGIDVIINSLAGLLLHESWRLCAEMGRFIEVGKKDIVECGQLDMDVFARGATFTAFDLTTLFYSEKYSNRFLWQR